MQTAVEETDRHVVRLSVEVSPDEFARDLDRAYRKVASEVRVPGFRKGKVPRQIIDARIGRDVVLEEFLHDSLPVYYLRAVRENELAPIADPEFDPDVHDIEVDAAKPLRFTATVEVRPRLQLEPEQYHGVRVQSPPAEPTDEEVERYVDALRERFAELESVERPARTGDYVLADVRATVHGREVPEATRPGLLTEVGSNELVPELDAELEGKRKGDIVKINAKLPDDAQRFGEAAGTEVTLQALVKEVKAKKLPDADDEFAKTASEFDSVAELREDVRTRLRSLKEAEARAVVRDEVLRAVSDAVEIDLPERLVDEETEHRVRRAEQRATEAGITLQQALDSQGWDELRFRTDARAHAVRALKGDLVLEAVARREGIEATREDVEREITTLAQATGRSPKEVARVLERSGQVASLAGDIIRSKALDLLVEHAEVEATDAPATPTPEASDPPEDGHD